LKQDDIMIMNEWTRNLLKSINEAASPRGAVYQAIKKELEGAGIDDEDFRIEVMTAKNMKYYTQRRKKEVEFGFSVRIAADHNGREYWFVPDIIFYKEGDVYTGVVEYGGAIVGVGDKGDANKVMKAVSKDLVKYLKKSKKKYGIQI